jgi:arginyl-tRNA synthetase
MATTLLEEISGRMRAALESAGFAGADPGVAAAADARFGDYQSNAAMVLAKQARRNPREVAAALLAALDVSDLCAPPQVAGAGFINFAVRPERLGERLGQMAADDRLGVPLAPQPRAVVIDFSAPNVAKPMHVGHIRSTILGDALARIARFLGHRVITDNHIGDWGTQFGKVIHGWKTRLDRAALERDPITELVRLYKETNALADADPAVLGLCRDELVKLQAGDPDNLAIWKECVALSWREFESIYARLDIRFDVHLGESFYNDRLAPLVDRLLASGLAEISDGAACVFLRDVPALADKPCLIRKGDGGFLYATTDLATIDYRVEEWNPDEIWYVTGAPQQLHFQQVFEVARRMGHRVALQHIPFGSILGEDRKLMKTRSGENVGLREVLDEGVARALAAVTAKNPDMDVAERARIADVIGIGAVKYAELSQFRMTDYVFAWDKLLALQGNTAPYLQNAYVRIQSIFRKAEAEAAAPAVAATAITVGEPAEARLALYLLRYGETVPLVLDDFRPNSLTTYLFELADAFHGFYEACPVLKSDEPLRSSRLALCELTARVLRHGLDLLGIGVPERM